MEKQGWERGSEIEEEGSSVKRGGGMIKSKKEQKRCTDKQVLGHKDYWNRKGFRCIMTTCF